MCFENCVVVLNDFYILHVGNMALFYSKKISNFFKILHHIKSLDTYMEH